MNILLPMDGDDVEESQLVSLNDVKKWALLSIDAGKVTEIKYYDTREEISEWVDTVVVINNSEYVWPFMEEQIMVLVAPMQRTIEDIVEAYLFKELHEIGVV